MDMVVQKNDDVDINFDTDPLTPRIVDGKWLMATGTSLGADDGIGVATCFAILSDPSLRHGPLEVLVTRDEETGMFGALELERGLLRSSFLLNVDSEEENALCIGCAGGFTLEFSLPVARQPAPGTAVLRLTLNDFRGGHSGCDIDSGRANPLQTAGRLLARLPAGTRIVNIDCGTADNAIPRKCVVDIAVPAGETPAVEAALRSEFAAFQREFHRTEPSARLEIAPISGSETPVEVSSSLWNETPIEASSETPIDSSAETPVDSSGTLWSETPIEASSETPIEEAASRRLIHFLNVCPFGVQRYSPAVKSAVESSLTCAIARSSPREVGLVVSVRSSVASQLDWLHGQLRCLADLCGMRVSPRKAEFPRCGRFM